MPSRLRNWNDVDRALAEWRDRLEVVDDNLREFDDEPTLRKLEGRPGVPALALEGETVARVGPALRALRDVWTYRDRLAEVIEHAAELRKTARPWSEARQLQTVDELLNGPSITLLGATTPLALRSLVASAQERNKLTPAALLEGMQQAYAAARDAVFAIDAAWDTLLPSFTRVSRELSDLQGRASALGLSVDTECADLASTVDELRRRAECDPLGTLHDSAQSLEPRLNLLRAQVDALEQTRTSVLSDLDRAESLVADLRAANTSAAQARRRCEAEIHDRQGLVPPIDEAHIDGLGPWLATLRTTSDEGRWAAARVGLDRWLAAATDYLTAAQRAAAANSTPLQQRDQLAGLLRARRAQARDLAQRGLYLTPAAEAAGRRAETLQSERPCRLSELEASVTAYDQAVSALAHTSR